MTELRRKLLSKIMHVNFLMSIIKTIQIILVYTENSLQWKENPINTCHLISKFKEKSNHFSALFATRCTLISNDSTLLLVTTPVTNASLSSISFKDQDIPLR